jgi:plastocyanin
MRTAIAAVVLSLVTGCASTHAIAPQVAGAGVDFGQAEVVEVTLSSFAFKPSEIRLQAGKPYALKLVDVSGGHDFTAPEFFAAARVAPDDAAKVAKGQVELKAGESAVIHLVPAAGTFDLACTHFGHAALGMKGRIVVGGAS